MNPRKRKALLDLYQKLLFHKGHTIIVGLRDRKKYVVKDVVILNETIMFKVDDELFATIYFDSVMRCSCEPAVDTSL